MLELLNPLRYVPAAWWAALESESAGPATDPAARRMNRVISNVRSQLTVAQVGRSYVISLTFLSEDPVKAARIANGMVDEYLASQVEAKYAAADRATDWLKQRIDELRANVLEAEAKIVQYRTKNHLVNTDEDNPLTLQYFQLNTQLALAQAQRAEAEARFSRARVACSTRAASGPRSWSSSRR